MNKNEKEVEKEKCCKEQKTVKKQQKRCCEGYNQSIIF